MLLTRAALPVHLRVSEAAGPNEEWTERDERVVHEAVEALLPPVTEPEPMAPPPAHAPAPFVRMRLPMKAQHRHVLVTVSPPLFLVPVLSACCSRWPLHSSTNSMQLHSCPSLHKYTVSV